MCLYGESRVYLILCYVSPDNTLAQDIQGMNLIYWWILVLVFKQQF